MKTGQSPDLLLYCCRLEFLSDSFHRKWHIIIHWSWRKIRHWGHNAARRLILRGRIGQGWRRVGAFFARRWLSLVGGLCPEARFRSSLISAIASGMLARRALLVRSLVEGSSGNPLLHPQHLVKATKVPSRVTKWWPSFFTKVDVSWACLWYSWKR